jgi:hypothetical protein
MQNVTYTEATTDKPTTNPPRNRNQVSKEQQRTARRPYEAKLTNRHRHQKRIRRDARKRCPQKTTKTINGSNIEGKKPILQAGNKYSNGIRLQCITEEDEQLLRKAEVNWSDQFQGQSIHIPKYRIVMHGVSKVENDQTEDKGELSTRVEKENPDLCQQVVHCSSPTKDPQREDNTRRPQSLVIFLNDTKSSGKVH